MLFPLNLQTAVVGFDFRFGHKGAGDVAALQKLGDGKMSVVTVPPFLFDGGKVGSSAIRIALKTGKLSDANRWFGRNYHIRGSVIHGEKRGRKIGFPTANLELGDASGNTTKKFRDKCGSYNIPLVIGFDRESLGTSVGKPERVVLAVTDQGFAEMISKKMETMSEVEYIE